MKLNFLMCISLIIFYSCKEAANKGSDEIVRFDSTFIKPDSVTAFDVFIMSFSDSINIASNASQLPTFIKDPQFDYKHVGIFSPFHTPLPLRFIIMEKVNSCKALDLIINSNDSLYRLKPEIKNSIEVKYSDQSFYSLALNRHRTLGCD